MVLTIESLGRLLVTVLISSVVTAACSCVTSLGDGVPAARGSEGSGRARGDGGVSVAVPGGLLVQEPDVGRPQEAVQEPDQDRGVRLGEAGAADGGAGLHLGELEGAGRGLEAGRSLVRHLALVAEDVGL